MTKASKEVATKYPDSQRKEEEIQTEEVVKLSGIFLPKEVYRELSIRAATHEPMMKLHRYCGKILAEHVNGSAEEATNNKVTNKRKKG